MGFDLSSEIHSILNGDLSHLYFTSEFKNLLIYYLFFCIIQITIDFLFEEVFQSKNPKSKIKKYITYTVFLLLLLFIFFILLFIIRKCMASFSISVIMYLQWLLLFLVLIM